MHLSKLTITVHTPILPGNLIAFLNLRVFFPNRGSSLGSSLFSLIQSATFPQLFFGFHDLDT